MNKHEKEIAKAQLSSEEKTLKELQQVFKKARQDVQEKISELNARQDMQNLQSIIYQKKYQQAILAQINEALADLKSGQYKTVEEYLVESYDNGYIGMMYSLQSQGIPMTIPINDRNVVRALTTDSKLSSKYYQSNPLKGRLAENVDLLKQRVRSNLSRGIIAGKSWLDVAVDIASGMNNPFDIALKDAMRIVRTEGHRVHQQGFLDAGDKAKDKGADILKQWDATMDRKTRPAHQQADGQIVEWDEYFTVGGEKMKAPSVGGSAKNVCNCRCQLLQRARWALDESELETLQKRAEYFGLDKSESFEDFKQKYLKLPEKADTIDISKGVMKYTQKEIDDALEYYVSGEGQWLNKYLRDPEGWVRQYGITEDEKRIIDIIKTATESETVKETVLYRSVDAQAIFGKMSVSDYEDLYSALRYGVETPRQRQLEQEFLSNIKGKVITEKAFMSTTKDMDLALDWGDFTGSNKPTVIQFKVPNGIKGLDLAKFDVEGDEQYEVLLTIGQKYKIIDVSTKNGNIFVKAEFITDSKPITKVNSVKKLTHQFANTPAMNEYGYFSKEQEMFRFNSIKELTGCSDDDAKIYLEALCGTSDEYSGILSNVPKGWFYGSDMDIRTATSGEFYDKAKIIDSYIQKAPKYEGEIYRGVSLDRSIIDSMKVGSTFRENGNLSSWSSSIDVANVFAEGRSEELGKTPVVFITNNHPYSTPASHLSIFGTDESEVLVSNMDLNEYNIDSIEQVDGVYKVWMSLKG